MQTLLTQRAANSHLRCVSEHWMPPHPPRQRERKTHKCWLGAKAEKQLEDREMGRNAPRTHLLPSVCIYRNTYFKGILLTW